MTEPTPLAFPAGMNKKVEYASGEAVFGLSVLDKLVAGPGRPRLRHVDGRPSVA